jgi:hypothetical protein
MTTKTEALKLALEALMEHGTAYLGHSKEYQQAILKSKEALAQPAMRKTTRDEKISNPEVYEVPWTSEDMAYRPGGLAQPEQEHKGKQFQAKFNIEDRVWYMKNNKPTEVVISAIEIFYVNTNQDRITYNAKNVDHSVSWLDHTNLRESWLFKSKTELLESL